MEDDDERRVVREGGLVRFPWSSISALSPLDRFRLDCGGGGGGLFSGSGDNLAEERVERRGGICMRVEALGALLLS